MTQPTNTGSKQFSIPPYAPYDDKIDFYIHSRSLGFGFAVPWEYTDWRDESLSWKNTCYLHAGLNPSPTFRIKGPQAMKFLSDHLVNSFTQFPVGALKHGIMCNQSGKLMAHGVLMRIDEEEFLSFYLAPYAAYKLYSGNYDATGEFVTDEFIYQVSGPKSLEILEQATGECLHDIRFARHRLSDIAGNEVRISRVGMSGSLAYEVHGKLEQAEVIYNTIWRAGEPVGMRKLGFHAYQMNHTEAGFPQSFVHFPFPWEEDKGFVEFLQKVNPGFSRNTILSGSVGNDMQARYRSPFDVGWGKTVRFDHDFAGREALEKEAEDNPRGIATLVWNEEDILDVHRSEYSDEHPFKPITPIDVTQKNSAHQLNADKVFVGKHWVGVSSGRAYSFFYRQMLSLCTIESAYLAEGTEVEVLWGNEGERQKRIRAKVSRFPYLTDVARNESMDVSEIPCSSFCPVSGSI